MKIIFNIQLQARWLHKIILAAVAVYICYLPMLAEADYQNDVQIASELWVDITYQDYLYMNGAITQDEWQEAQINFRRSFSGIKGNDPKIFEDGFARAVAKILSIGYSPKAALMAIKTAPEGVCVEEYRDDVWRGSRIQTKANENLAYNSRNLGKQPRDSLTKAERDDLYDLVNVKYGRSNNPIPINIMFHRNFDMVFARDVVWSDVIPTASSSSVPLTPDGKRKVAARMGVRKRPVVDIPVTNTCMEYEQFVEEVEKFEKLDQAAVKALIKARKASDGDVTSGIEYGGFIIKKDEQYLAGSPVRGKSTLISACVMAHGLHQEGYGIFKGDESVEGYTNWPGKACMYKGVPALFALPNNSRIVATYHVHPPKYLAQDMLSRFFSKGDVLMAYNFNIKSYIVTPDCNVRRHTPDRRMIKPDLLGNVVAPLLDPSVWGLTALTTKDLIVIPEPDCQ